MIRSCTECGQKFDAIADWARLCKPCYINRKNREQFDAGYDAGYRAGRRAGVLSRRVPQLSVNGLRALRQLTHPDLHSPARRDLATEITAWLNDQLDKKRDAA